MHRIKMFVDCNAASVDGLDQVDLSSGGNALKNQAVAFLQATSFLKG
jgi:hypothetical protein